MIAHSSPWITEKDNNAVLKVLQSGQISHGQEVQRFEEHIAKFLKAKGCIATSTGRLALSLALKALKVSRNAKVILPTYVCPSVLKAVINHGAKPVICDIGENWVVTPKQIKPHLTKDVEAILAVHTFGMPADISAIKKLGVPVIEDACQAFGLHINKTNLAGTLGDFGICSFSATKCFTTGEGGALICNSSTTYESALENKFDVGLTNMQAALGISQLNRYQNFISRRIQIRKRYLEELDHCRGIQTPDLEIPFTYRFVIKLTNGQVFEKVQKAFEVKGVAVRKGVDKMLHQLAGYPDKKFPIACNLFDTTLSLPYYPAMSDEDVNKVISATKAIF